MIDGIWSFEGGGGPIIATAVHNGHDLRDEVACLMAVGEADRLREEDPFTGEWTSVGSTRIVGLRSRFEVDLNRRRDTAVYRGPDDAWGLQVWTREPPDELIARSLEEYDAFYACMQNALAEAADKNGVFVVFDLHSYNHRRGGPGAPPEDDKANPQVNIGTGTMDRRRWAPIVDRFISALREFPFPGGGLDVRENVKFRGGFFPRWVHETFPDTGCALAIEFKKFFMDEWTGEPNRFLVEAIGMALNSAATGVLKELEHL